jgi:sugar (pentulose or hexulose) kinase
MDRQIAQVPIGARGLFCSPVAAGSTRPIAGMLWGLTAAHTKDDIGRAVLEGIAFELRTLLEDAQTAHTPVRSLVMVGGAAQSPCWPQIIADVTGLAVTVPAVQEAAARGAALLAGMGMGHWTAETGLAPADSANRTFAPSQDARQTYDKLFHDYQHMWQKFRDTLSTESSNP